MCRGEVYTGSWQGNLREMDHLEDLKVHGRIMLECHQRVEWEHRLELSGSEQGQLQGPCKFDKGPSLSIKEFPHQLMTGLLLKKDSALWSQFSFISTALPFAVQRLCAGFINQVVKLSAVGIYWFGDILQGAVCEEFTGFQHLEFILLGVINCVGSVLLFFILYFNQGHPVF